MIVKRYEIYWANLDPTIGEEIKKTRPVVIISDNWMNKFLRTVVICPLTTKLHPQWRSRIQIENAGKKAEIAADQIRTISKLRLIEKINNLAESDAKALRKLITEMYGE